jgi:tetratricopeptide (TPR) repeat protein
VREAIEFLTRAADIDLELDRPDDAFEALDRARALEIDRRNVSAGRQIAERLLAMARTPAQRVSALGNLAWCDFHSDRTEYAGQHAQAMLAAAEAQGDRHAAALAHELLGLVASAEERFGDAVLHMRMALPELEAAPDRRRYIATLNHLGVLLDQRGRPAEAAEPLGRAVVAARALDEAGVTSVALRNAAVNRVHAGDTAAAYRLLQEAHRFDIALDAGQEATGITRTLLIVVSADLGRLDEAIEHGDAALARFENANQGWVGATRTSRASVWLHLGQWARVLQELDAPVAGRIPGHSQARRLMLRARALAPLGQPVLHLLDEALALAPTDGRIDARLLIQLERMRHLDDAAALSVADEIEREARERGLCGFERWALLRSLAPAARLCLDLPARVRRVDALAARLHAYSQTAAEAWLARAQAALVQREEALAAKLALEGVRWLFDTARAHVPLPFQDSFLNRHPVHRALRALADELG